MKINKDTKWDVEIGDYIQFDYGDKYLVLNVYSAGYWNQGLKFTLQDVETKRCIYGYNSSECYGAELIKGTTEAERNLKRFLEKLDSFVVAMEDLMEAWEQLDADSMSQTDGGKYPFQLAFDELYYQVAEWGNDLHEKLVN